MNKTRWIKRQEPNCSGLSVSLLLFVLILLSPSVNASSCSDWGDFGDYPPYAIEILKEQDIVRGNAQNAHSLAMTAMVQKDVQEPADVEDTACLSGINGIDVNIFSASLVDTWGLLYEALMETLKNFACAFAVTYYNAKLAEGLDIANSKLDEYIMGPMNEMASKAGLPPDLLDKFDFSFKPNTDGEYVARSERSQYSVIEEHGVGMLEDLLNEWGSELWSDYDPSLFNKRQAESKKARKKMIEAAQEAGEAPFGGVPIFPTDREDWKKVGDMSWSDVPKGVVAVSSSLMVDLVDLGIEIGGGLSDHALMNPLEFSKNCLAAVGSTRKVPGCFEEEK